MRILAAVLVVAAMLVGPLGLMGTAAAANRDLTPVVIGPIPTDRFDGGNLIAVKAGDALFGVRYGTSDHLNDIVIFAEYKRFLGGAQIVDGQGNELASRGIPVYTVLAQSLNRFIEFRERNATDGFDLTSVDPFHVPLTQNVPVKVLMLHTAWELTGLTNVTSGGVTYVNFTVSATNLAYTHVLDNTSLGDEMLNRVAFTFHLVVGTHDVTANVPWYRVTVDDGNRYDITHVEFLGYRNVTGPAIAMGAKYDHLIEGWDFAYPTDRLALETHFVFGNYIPERTAEFIHQAYMRDHADDGTRTIGGATLNATEAFAGLPTGVNLTPFTILAAQLAVVGIAMGPALYLRAKARRQK